MKLIVQPNQKKYRDNDYRGIYSINFENGKRYIGMSNTVKARLREHITDSQYKEDLLPVHLAMRMYNYEFELLEDCQGISRKELGNREIYWIDYYETFKDKTKGYNLTPGGDGGQCGCLNSSAKLNEQQINEVYYRLQNDLTTFIYQIAAEYDISPEAISEINNGKRYYNEFLIYPLRNIHWMPPHKEGIDCNISAFKTEEQLSRVFYDIKYSQLSLQKLAKQYNVSYTTISKINRGLTYHQENMDYPIRKSTRNLILSYENIQKVYKVLLETDLSIKEIAKQFNVSEDTIRRLNKGTNYSMKDFQYPLRANKEFNQAVSTIFESEEQSFY